MFKRIAFLLIASLLIALAGCGGGGGSSSSNRPQSPTDLNIVDRVPTAPLVVTLFWTAPDDDTVTHYGVYRRALGETTFSNVATVPASQTSYTDLLTRNIDAEYEIVSINSSGAQSAAAGPIFSEAPIPGPPG